MILPYAFPTGEKTYPLFTAAPNQENMTVGSFVHHYVVAGMICQFPE
jgi:hypothetical protein